MRKWRVARIKKDGVLHVTEREFWTKSGAQAAATHLNLTFGALEAFAASMHGHNYFATNTDKIPLITAELDKRREEKK